MWTELLTEIRFNAPEYQQDRSIRYTEYRFVGEAETGWRIERHGKPWLELGPGYVAVKTLYCGICSTDLARHLLPFPLPQISGHEVVGEYQQQPVAIEINASHTARSIKDVDCIYCNNGLHSHCPDRMTLGIDRLPGGFAPWILAPVQAIYPLPTGVSPQAGVLIEPFAAAVRAVETSPPRSADKVAVLGPRRLGMLIIAALDSYRKQECKHFEISAVMRHEKLQNTARELGADHVVILKPENKQDIEQQFDIVFDTTGSPSGFELAVKMAKRTVHLKSTHGQAVMGLESMTSIVINEQILTAYSEQKLSGLLSNCLAAPGERRIYVSPAIHHVKLPGAAAVINELDFRVVPDKPFEFAIVGTLEEINRLTQPVTIQGQNLLRAKGSILLAGRAFEDQPFELLTRISQGALQLVTSRCGSFEKAIEVLQQCPGLAERLKNTLLTRTMGLGKLEQAMQLAARSEQSIKVVVQTG